MIIHRDSFVTLAYRLRLTSGEYVRGSAEEPEIMTFVAGYNELLPSLENRLLGLRPGEEKSFTIPAAEAFGFRDANLIQTYSRKRFPAGADLKPGMAVVPAPCAIPVEFPYRIVAVTEDTVVLDQNHPLAGEDLHYEVKVLEVRPATDEELASRQTCLSCQAGE